MSAELLSELTRVKTLFQLRAIVAAMGLDAQAIKARSDETAQRVQPERRERGPKDAPKGGHDGN